MNGSQLFYNKKTGKIEDMLPLMQIAYYEKIICETCKKSILSGQDIVDDGIVKGKFHHSNCY